MHLRLLIISNVVSLVVTTVAVVKWKQTIHEQAVIMNRNLQQQDCCGCNIDGSSGALVTDDCKFQDDYLYAIDILLSCGSERFDAPLRLHTFKRHSRNHERIFNDQLVTFRDSQLWFDAYNTNRCIAVANDNELEIGTSSCASFHFVSGSRSNNYFIRDTSTGLCAGLGNDDCNADRSTGGEECGGVDHRFLPLIMGDCDDALDFHFESEAQDCGNGATEMPNSRCF